MRYRWSGAKATSRTSSDQKPVVPPAQFLGGQRRVHVMDEPLSGDVEQLTEDVLLSDHHVLQALTVAELGVKLPGFGVDHVRAERSRVATEERVRQRAITPEEAGDMEAHQQVHEAIEEAITERRVASGRAEHAAIRQRKSRWRVISTASSSTLSGDRGEPT